MAERALVRTLRGLLDDLARSRRRSGDEQEVIHDAVAARVRALSREERILDAVDEAVGCDEARRAERIHIMGGLLDVPGAVDRLNEEFNSFSKSEKDCLLQSIGVDKLQAFAPLLNSVIEEDRDPEVRAWAVSAAGRLQSKVNAPVLRRLVAKHPPEMRGVLLQAVLGFAFPASRRIYREAFTNPSDDYDKVIGAWGLGKLGDEKAIEFLAEVIYPFGDKSAASYLPGQQLRAAQALCDVLGWPFEWNVPYIEQVRALWESRKRSRSKARRSRS